MNPIREYLDGQTLHLKVVVRRRWCYGFSRAEVQAAQCTCHTAVKIHPQHDVEAYIVFVVTKLLPQWSRELTFRYLINCSVDQARLPHRSVSPVLF